MSKSLGGSEIQCNLIAENLYSKGWDVIYLAIKGKIGDFKYQIYEVDRIGSISFLRCLWRFRSNSVVYWRYNKKNLLFTVVFSTILGIPFIFSGSSINDYFSAGYKKIDGRSWRYSLKNLKRNLRSRFNFLALNHADAVIVNNSDHLPLISRYANHFYIPNYIYSEVEESIEIPDKYVVWVGNVKPGKNAHLYAELAEKSNASGLRFILIGNNEMLIKDKNWVKPDNLDLLGSLAIEKTNSLIKNSQFLIFTAQNEGFPNVILQSIQLGIPVLSVFEDPASLITMAGLGKLMDIDSIANFLNSGIWITERDKMIECIDNYNIINQNGIDPADMLIDLIESIK